MNGAPTNLDATGDYQPADQLPAESWAGHPRDPSARRILAEVAERLVVDDLADLVTRECLRSIFTDQLRDTTFRARLHASVSQNVHALRDLVAGRRDLDRMEFDEVLAFASVQAQLRIPQMSMQRSYRVSFRIQWQRWTEELQNHVQRMDLDRDQSLEAAQELTETILAYQDHVASRVAEAYTRDYDALNQSRAHLRRALVRRLVEGEDISLGAADRTIIGYPLDQEHLAVALPALAEAEAGRLGDALRGAARAQGQLVYPLSLSSSVVWLSRISRWQQDSVDAVVEELRRHEVAASVSDPAVGIDGLRGTLRHAMATERVRSAWLAGSGRPSQVLRYSDVGLEILLLQDHDLARQFVRAELGSLAQDSPEAGRLRQTLEASFLHGSHVAAGESLGLHEHTVRNRLSRAQTLLGRGLQERPTELQVALRLHRVLAVGPSEDSPDR